MVFYHRTFEIKVDVHVFAKSGRVVIPVGLCIPKRLEDVIRLRKRDVGSMHSCWAQLLIILFPNSV